MQLRNCGRPELIINRAAQQKRNTPENGRQGKPRNTSCFRVARRTVFDIHGNVICQPRAHDCLQLLRKRAVCVQLDGVAQRLDFFQQSGKLRAQKRLSAGNGNTVEKPLPFFQKRQQLVFVHAVFVRCGEQRRVMAERAAKIAAGQKHRTGRPPWIIQQRQLLKSLNLHQWIRPPVFLYMNGAIACRYICSTNRITLCWSNRSYPSNTTLRSPFDRQR